MCILTEKRRDFENQNFVDSQKRLFSEGNVCVDCIDVAVSKLDSIALASCRAVSNIRPGEQDKGKSSGQTVVANVILYIIVCICL